MKYMNKKLKIVFIVVVIIGVLFLGYQSLTSQEESSSSGIATEGGQFSTSINPNEIPTTVSPKELSSFSSLLSVLESVNLETEFFSHPLFLSLRDNAPELGDILVGRSNPFTPAGIETGGVSLSQLNSQALTIETVQPDPSLITSTGAEFSAFVEFEGTIPVEVVFQYNKEGSVPSITAPVRITQSGFVKTTVANLEKNTRYTVISIGTRGTNRRSGSPMIFTTKP